MAKLIGIIMRRSTSKMGHQISIAYNDLISAVRKSGGIPIMVPVDDINPYLELCDGFILQGGDDISRNSLDILKKLRDKNIPTLGICLGMQEMGFFGGGKLINIPNHSGNIMHEIKVIADSLLYKILGVEKIMVNSRHKSAIMFPKMKICAVSDDGIIEAICDNNLKFFLGVEWHPENMYDHDINAKKIFDYFIKMCDDKHISR